MQNGQSPSVLIVDDEEMVLTSIKAFLQLETNFKVYGFNDPEEASRFAQDQPVDVVVSDYLMPKMNGIELLGRMKELQPETNQVMLFQYLEKPWENSQLLLVVRAGAERAQLFRELRGKVEALDNANSQIKTVQRRLLEAFL